MVKKGETGKKIILGLAFVLLLLPAVFAYDVAYIAKTSKTVDQNIVNSFSEMNLSVGIVLDKDVPRTDFSKYKLVLVSDDFLREASKYYDISKHKTIVVNKYYGIEFGLTDYDGVSQLASTSPQDVILKNSLLVQVYTQAKYFIGGESIPYYYLGDENKADGFQSVARADNGNNDELGDVISVAEKGLKLKNGKTTQEKICFFGIAKTTYWTPYAKKLFKEECVGFVAFDVICSKNSDCDDNDNYTKDTCANPGTRFSYCKNEQIRCLTELDCGTDGFTGNKFCSEKNILQNFVDYTCNNAGTPESSCTFTNGNKLIQGCSDVCLEGKCHEIKCRKDSDCDDTNIYTKDICLNPGTLQSGCSHKEIKCFSKSDCGVDGFTGEKFCSGKDVKRKFVEYECNSGGTPESYCSSKTSDKLIEECSGTCFNGKCEEIKCRTNEECDDGNSYTIDECVFQGTAQSECRNTRINCAQDSDCGFNGFFREEYCSLNNIFKNYQIARCNDAGTKNSHCDLEVQQKLVKQCDFACENGKCIICDEDSDCDDDDSSTKDSCMMPNTINSYCKNERENVECSKNSDCGTDGFIEDAFCKEDDVLQKYKTYTCNKPGTPESYCSNLISTKLKENCNDCGKFKDNFNSLDSARWNLIKGNEAIENGRLKAVGTHGNITDSSAGVSSKWLLHGDFDIQVDYDATAQPASDSSATASLTVMGTGARQIVYTLYNTKKMDGSYDINAWTNQNPAGIHWSNENIIDYSSGSFRLKRIGMTMQGYQKQGNNWVKIAEISDGDVSDMIIFLRAYDNLKTTLGFNPRTPIAYFDNFIVNNNGCNGETDEQCSNGKCVANTCGMTRVSPSATSSGIKITALSQSVNSDAKNTLLASVENLDSFSKTVQYKKYSCRCQQHLGDPIIPGCYEFWPFENSCKLVNETMVLAPNEKKNIEISAVQYQNMKCGSFQLDLSLISVNGVPDKKLGAWSFADLCVDCLKTI